MFQNPWGLPSYISSAGNYLAGMMLELATCVASLLLVVAAFRKYSEKRNKTTLQIMFVFTGFCLGSLLTGLGKLLVVTGAVTYTFIVFDLYMDGLAIMSLMISNTAFYLFTLNVFYDIKPRGRAASIIIYVGIEILVAILGLFILLARVYNTLVKNLLTGAILAQSIFTYLLLATRAIKIAEKALGLDRIGIQLVSLSGFLIIGFFALFALDVLNLFKMGNMSAFYFVAWAVADAAMVVTYLGYFRPSLLQRLAGQKPE
jgi:hypothetical protein